MLTHRVAMAWKTPPIYLAYTAVPYGVGYARGGVSLWYEKSTIASCFGVVTSSPLGRRIFRLYTTFDVQTL